MANPTPRADALRAMREARFEAAQRQNKQDVSKPAAIAKAKPASAAVEVMPVADVAPSKPTAKKPAVKKAAAAKPVKKADDKKVAKEPAAKKKSAKKG